jgi:hypothetical protein
MGIGAAVGIAPETPEGTYAEPTLSVTFTQESMKAQRPGVEQGSITGDRSVDELLDGVKSGAGDVDMEVDGGSQALLLHYANGNASGALTSQVISGRISAAPTLVAAAGGTLAPAAYKYKLASVWERTATAEKWVLPVGAEASVTTASADLTAAVSWTNPTGQPTGWTLAGTAIYRTAAAGAADSEKFIHFVAAPGSSWNDDGSVALGTKLPVVPAAPMKEHIFKKAFTIGSNPLPAFSLTVNKDNDEAVIFMLCRCGGWEINIGENGTVITSKASILARDWDTAPNFVPSLTTLRKMMAWGVTVSLDGVFTETVRGMTLKIDNGAALKPGLSGQPRMSDVIYGRRKCTGTLPRDYQNQNFLKKLKAAQRFSIDAWAVGQGIVQTDSEITLSAGVTARPIPYMIHIEVPRAALMEAGANASGPAQMVENLNWMALTDPVEATDVRITFYNLNASYT